MFLLGVNPLFGVGKKSNWSLGQVTLFSKLVTFAE